MRNNIDATTLYENLRGDALLSYANYCRRTQGLTLFIMKGMTAWIEVLSNCMFYNMQSNEKEPVFLEQRNLPLDLHAEIAILLANMAITNWETRTL